jgi:hypothetical protein
MIKKDAGYRIKDKSIYYIMHPASCILYTVLEKINPGQSSRGSQVHASSRGSYIIPQYEVTPASSGVELADGDAAHRVTAIM